MHITWLRHTCNIVNCGAQDCALPALAARLFGDYIVDADWLRASQKAHKAILPCHKLAVAIASPRELWVHPGLQEHHRLWLYKLLYLTRPDNSSIASQWTIQQARRDLKNTRAAWALHSAKKAEHAKERHHQATQAGDQQALRDLRGQVVTLDEFADNVTHFL